MPRQAIVALIVGLLVGFATAVLFAIVYAITDIYLSGHSIEVENYSIELGFIQTTVIDLAFMLTTVGSGILGAWLYLVNNSRKHT